MSRATKYEIEFFGCCKTSSGGSGGSGGSSGESASRGGRGGYDDMLAKITLSDDEDQIGTIKFFRDGASIPEDFAVLTYTTSGDHTTMHVPYSMFGDIYKALRNEKPIKIKYRDRTEYRGAVLEVGRQEPIGEND